MKTTIELPEQLFRRTKAAAARRGLTLKDFFTRAAQHELARLESEDQETRAAAPPWHRFLREPSSAELEELNRIEKVIATEFSEIDAESWR